MERSLAAPAGQQDPTLLFSRFDPREVRPVGTVVKVRGRMTLAKGEGKNAGEVLVHTDYTFVYPVVKTRPGADEVTRTIVRRVITFSFADPATYLVTKGTLGVTSWKAAVGNDDCHRAEDGFHHPVFREDLLADPGPARSGPAADPYDRSTSLDDLPQECGTVTRS
jgi:hypothetical protein